MIIILSKEENIEAAKSAIKKIFDDDTLLNNCRDLFYQTSLDHEEMAYCIDKYVR